MFYLEKKLEILVFKKVFERKLHVFAFEILVLLFILLAIGPTFSNKMFYSKEKLILIVYLICPVFKWIMF